MIISPHNTDGAFGDDLDHQEKLLFWVSYLA